MITRRRRRQPARDRWWSEARGDLQPWTTRSDEPMPASSDDVHAAAAGLEELVDLGNSTPALGAAKPA